MLGILTGTLCGAGLYLVLKDLFRIPYAKTVRALDSIAKRQKSRSSAVERFLEKTADFLAGKIRLNEFRRAKIGGDLKTAQLDMTPEQFTAKAAVKGVFTALLALPLFFIFPVLSAAVPVIAVFVYRNEIKSIGKRIRTKREKIENELPRLVFTIGKTLKHSRDVYCMLDTYRDTAGPELKSELDITVADMGSGNYEGAITRLESRVGSSMMSDVCRGLIGILRGDDTEMYWEALSLKFSDTQRQQLRLEAQKVPKKVNRLSLCLLGCFLLTYIVVILDQIVRSLGVLFG